MKPWKYQFNFLMQIAICNAYIIYQKFCSGKLKSNYSQMDFRHELAISLIGGFSCRKTIQTVRPKYIGPGMSDQFKTHENVRLFRNSNHRCAGHKKLEGTIKRTAYGCALCNLPLCGACHARFHAVNT